MVTDSHTGHKTHSSHIAAIGPFIGRSDIEL